MQTATIKVDYVNQPKKQGGKYGNLNSGGTYYMVPTDRLGFFSKGETYEIGFNQQKWGDNSVNVVTHVNGQDITGASQDRSAPAPPKGTIYTPKQQDLPPILSNVLSHAIQAGIVQNPNELKIWAGALKDAINVFQGMMKVQPPEPGSKAEPNDDIPF